MFKRWAVITAVCFMFAFLVSPIQGGGGSESVLDTDHVEAGLFYKGQKINFHIATPAGYDVVIRITGKEEDLELKKKGKRFGIFWVTVGETMKIDSLPSLYIIQSSGKLAEISSGEVLRRLGIGYRSLAGRMKTQSESDQDDFIFGEVIKLKEHEKLYLVEEGTVKIRDLPTGVQEAYGSFILPSKAPVGEYEVDFFGFENGAGTLLKSSRMSLEFSPATSFITSMARKHGLFYGCMASIIAILAGLVTGFVFKGKGSH